MDFLLDTHTLIWFLNGDRQISKKAISIIENPNNNKFVSIASLWEISIKLGLKKLEFDGTTMEILALMDANGFEVLPISNEHVVEYEELPFIHRDPFDRMLVAQAAVEPLTLITRDDNISRYDVQVLW